MRLKAFQRIARKLSGTLRKIGGAVVYCPIDMFSDKAVEIKVHAKRLNRKRTKDGRVTYYKVSIEEKYKEGDEGV